MEVTFKKLAKCLFGSGRREFVREMLEQELTRDKILAYVGDAVAYGINRGVNAVPPERRGELHAALGAAHGATGRLLEVTDPRSEGGFGISPNEAATICDEIGGLTASVFTDATVKALHDRIVAKVP